MAIFNDYIHYGMNRILFNYQNYCLSYRKFSMWAGWLYICGSDKIEVFFCSDNSLSWFTTLRHPDLALFWLTRPNLFTIFRGGHFAGGFSLHESQSLTLTLTNSRPCFVLLIVSGILGQEVAYQDKLDRSWCQLTYYKTQVFQSMAPRGKYECLKKY